MTQTSDTVVYRIASRQDETDLLAVLEKVAPEIPLSIDAEDSQDPIKGIIRQCHESGKSWVAVNTDGTVVGFALAKPDLHEQQTAVSLRYIGVSPNSRGRGIFSTLMKKLKANSVPLTASVLHNNRSAMVDRLVKNGFKKVRSDAKETKLRWAPEAG
jgi:N-acetylglutamate synthase-like GNAT family acetyltransferase